MLDCHDGVPVKPDPGWALQGRGRAARGSDMPGSGGNLSLVVSGEHRDPDGFDVPSDPGHLLLASGLRRTTLHRRPRHPILCPGCAPGLLRGSSCRHERRRSRGPHRRRQENQSPQLHHRGDRGGGRQAGRASPRAIDPPCATPNRLSTASFVFSTPPTVGSASPGPSGMRNACWNVDLTSMESVVRCVDARGQEMQISL